MFLEFIAFQLFAPHFGGNDFVQAVSANFLHFRSFSSKEGIFAHYGDSRRFGLLLRISEEIA